MEDLPKTLRALALAGARTLVLGVCLTTLVWLVYLRLTITHPLWALALFGANASWEWVERVCLGALVVLQVVLWLMCLATAWLWFAARAEGCPGLTSAGRTESRARAVKC